MSDETKKERKPVLYPVPQGGEVYQCACGAAITFHVTARGARMPLSMRTARDVEGVLKAEPHWGDCPKANRFKSPRRATVTPAKERTCRRCGCTQARACKGGCSWVAPDLCSRCTTGAGDSRTPSLPLV